MADNIVDDYLNKIIDVYALAFLDEFEEAYDRLPSPEEHRIWMVGFVDGIAALKEAIYGEGMK